MHPLLPKRPLLDQFRAYVLGNLRAASRLYARDMQALTADGSPAGPAHVWACDRARMGIKSAGIYGTVGLIDLALDARMLSTRWPDSSVIWMTITIAAALAFCWLYYKPVRLLRDETVRRYWRTGDPRRNTGFAASTSLARTVPSDHMTTASAIGGTAWTLVTLVLLQEVTFAWTHPGYWLTMVAVILAVFWPLAHLRILGRADEAMVVNIAPAA